MLTSNFLRVLNFQLFLKKFCKKSGFFKGKVVKLTVTAVDGLTSTNQPHAQHHVPYFRSGVLQEPFVKARKHKKIPLLIRRWTTKIMFRVGEGVGEIGKILLCYLQLLEDSTAVG